MAKTISELRNQSIQVRDASAAGENTATRVGTVLNDIVGHIEDYENTQSSNNSSQDAKIEGVKSSLNAEIARAKTEESNLSTQIDTERTERQAAVSREETARIQADNDEKQARINADNAEQDARIQADNTEKTARENADITLKTMIQTEVRDREKAVEAEAARAKAAEQANAQAIADETARAMAAEEAETTRAAVEEQRLQGEIDNMDDNLNSLGNKVNSNHDHLTDEVARLDLTDNEIKADLEAEIARAKAAEEANATAIAEEKAAIMGTDRIVDGAITTEKVADGAVTYDKLQPEIKEVVEGITYVENPEFIKYYCDADGRLIWWIYVDGSIDWAKGVPAPIQEELKKLEQKIKDNTEGDESLVARVTANEAAIVAINKALDRKVDGIYEDEPEYVRLNKDADDRILNGIKTDGTNYLPKADIDTLSLNGKEVDNDSVLSHKYTESPEFIKYYCDADGRLILWIYPDGSVDWAKGVPQPIQEELKKLDGKIPTDEHIKEVAGTVTTDELFQIIGPEVEVNNKLKNLRLCDMQANGFTNSSGEVLPTILHFSDNHNCADNLKHIDTLITTFPDAFDAVLNTGDLTGWTNETMPIDYDKYADKVLLAIGNHDASGRKTDAYYISSSDIVYDKYLANHIANWGVVQGGVKKNYYYKDFPAWKSDINGVRLIVLDNYDNNNDLYYTQGNVKEADISEQLTWLENVLMDAKNNNFSVICSHHEPPGSHLKELNSGFSDLETKHSGDRRFVDKVSSFIDNGGDFVCWLTGHVHNDDINTLSMDSRQIDLNIACCGYKGVLTTEGAILKGSSSQLCLNAIAVDTQKKQLKVLRLGRNIDRFFRTKNSIIINYSTKEIINNN